jgi:hypothetical protein
VLLPLFPFQIPLFRQVLDKVNTIIAFPPEKIAPEIITPLNPQPIVSFVLDNGQTDFLDLTAPAHLFEILVRQTNL